MDEVYGCVKYLEIPYETVMKMPIRQRKDWIRRHNHEQSQLDSAVKKRRNQLNGSTQTIEGDDLNVYARQEQNRLANR